MTETCEERLRDAAPIETLAATAVGRWLGFACADAPHTYVMRFQDHHIGNPFIRALHGGAVATMIEFSAETDLRIRRPEQRAELVSSAIDYLRVTRDADLYARVSEVRIARRLAFLEVRCWQDEEELPVARASCTLRLVHSDS